MKKPPVRSAMRIRSISFLALITLLLAALDMVVHHHAVECLLPDFARYVILSLLGSLVLVGLALCLGAVISRKEDYYDR